MRRLSIHRRIGYLGTPCGAAWMVAAGLAQSGAGARESPDARAILLRMADFLSKAPHMSVTIHSSYDALQAEGDKVEWNDARNVTLSPPDEWLR
jgi:hypothetical protein